ncbi:MAG: hypothetical protein V3V74_07485 [Nitrosomonadaceae bacterium]
MKIVYVDMDDTICDFTAAFDRALSDNPAIKYPQSQYGFFENLVPIDGAIEAVHKINQSDKYDVHILTAPSLRNPLCYTGKRVWVEKHLGYDFVQRLIISPDKSLLKGSFLVDDWISGRGQEDFEGQLIQFGSKAFPDWQAVLKQFDCF